MKGKHLKAMGFALLPSFSSCISEILRGRTSPTPFWATPCNLDSCFNPRQQPPRIACTPHHPLTLMLILYLKQTFDHKRHHIDVGSLNALEEEMCHLDKAPRCLP